MPGRVARVVAVAREGRAPDGVHVRQDGERVDLAGDAFAVGAMAERLRAALWAERLDAVLDRTPTGAVLTASATSSPPPPPP